MTHIYIIAGEPSGDRIGAELMASLTTLYEGNVRFSGIGGDHMTKAGLRSLFPMQDIALMGFAEVVPHLSRLKKRLKQTIEDIRDKQPDILITIDSPGFTFRVAKAVHTMPMKKVHYVAPTVWAYKPERAKKTAALFDHLLVLLPFETPYFEKEGLPTTFIGHPTVWRNRTRAHAQQSDENLRLAMLPGSRIGELKRHLPIYRETAERLLQEHLTLEIIMLSLPHLKETLTQLTADWPFHVRIITDESQKLDVLASCNAALAKSGTVTLECALARVPTITTYKANPISAFLVRRILKTPFVNLINIVAGKEIVPEYLQEQCRADILVPALSHLLKDITAAEAQREELSAPLNALGVSQEEAPSDIAAKVIQQLAHPA